MLRIGIDTGGTFTDFILVRDGTITAFKVASTPKHPEEAILQGLKKLLGEASVEFEVVHGTTVGTNAILERKGARTALVTTEGFEDILEIGRQNRPGLYQLSASKPKPLVARELRFGVRERVIPTGEVLTELDQDQIKELGETLAQLNVDSIAVCYLFSFANPQHEALTARLLASLGLPVSLSHQILPEYREYERTSTTVINAYLAPLMTKYISRMEEGFSQVAASDSSKGVLRIMQSNGGSISAQAAAEQPVRTVLSGPAGGVVGAYEVARLAGFERIITFDMGGTSTDVCLVSGAIHTTNEARVADLPLGIPVIDIHTVGAGGGSIARVDEGGALRVGPESAGADPGPICYGTGEQITVTDAHLILGRLDPDHFLGGQMRLDAARTAHYFTEFCQRFRAPTKPAEDAEPVVEVAQGVIDVANANMARAIKVISVERGYDPRDFALLAFGGAGGLHACDLADMLSIPHIILPKYPGLLSALGVLLSDVVKDYSQTVMLKQGEIDAEKLEAIFARLEKRGLDDLMAEGFHRSRITFSRHLDVRYVGQSFELSVSFSADFIAEFHRAHERRYGYADPTRPVELVTVRVKSRGVTKKPQLTPTEYGGEHAKSVAAEKPVYFNKQAHATCFYHRERLGPGNMIAGPAVILEYSATTVIPPDWQAVVDQYENLIISRKNS
jgi:N-methylhydantoinase A